ncbi:MAG: hypothetical protein AB7V43_22885 [Acidimicrobiia bacterium]
MFDGQQVVGGTVGERTRLRSPLLAIVCALQLAIPTWLLSAIATMALGLPPVTLIIPAAATVLLGWRVALVCAEFSDREVLVRNLGRTCQIDIATIDHIEPASRIMIGYGQISIDCLAVATVSGRVVKLDAGIVDRMQLTGSPTTGSRRRLQSVASWAKRHEVPIAFTIDARRQQPHESESWTNGHLTADRAGRLVWSREGIERAWPIARLGMEPLGPAAPGGHAFSSKVVIQTLEGPVVFAVHPGDDAILLAVGQLRRRHGDADPGA